jgi:hypothetical protein
VTDTDKKRVDILLDRFVEAARDYDQAVAVAVISFARKEAMASLLVLYARTAGADAETMQTLTTLVADDDDRVLH